MILEHEQILASNREVLAVLAAEMKEKMGECVDSIHKLLNQGAEKELYSVLSGKYRAYKEIYDWLEVVGKRGN